MKTITHKHSQEILEEMFKRVGEVYTPQFTSKQDWFTKHTWTQDEQDNFKDWLAKYLTKHRYASKKRSHHEAGKIIFNYGWKLKD